MGKALLWVGVGVIGLIIIGSLADRDDTSQNPDSHSVGYIPPGQCMSADKYNSAVRVVVKNTDWSRIRGSAIFDDATKSFMAGLIVFKEMARLGTPACPDLAPFYDEYRAVSGKITTVPAPSAN